MCHTNATLTPAATALTPLSDGHLDVLSRSLPLKQEAVVRNRWLELQPMLSYHAASTSRSPLAVVEFYKARHRRAVLLCLSRGLPWATIRRYRLDDPRRSDADRDAAIADAVRRRQSHLGLLRGRVLPERKPRQRRKKEQHDASANA